jgi:hypothetical protein
MIIYFYTSTPFLTVAENCDWYCTFSYTDMRKFIQLFYCIVSTEVVMYSRNRGIETLKCTGVNQKVSVFRLFASFKRFRLHQSWYLLSMNILSAVSTYDGVSKSFRTGRLERELQMVQFSATSCSCIAILWVILGSFATINLCVASQRVFIAVVYFVIDSVRKL